MMPPKNACEVSTYICVDKQLLHAISVWRETQKQCAKVAAFQNSQGDSGVIFCQFCLILNQRI